MKKKRAIYGISILTLAIIFIFACEYLYADAVFLKDGAYYEGKITSDDDSAVSIQAADKGILRFVRTKVLHVLYGDAYRQKRYFYLNNGSLAEGFVVSELRDQYIIRKYLTVNAEETVNKEDINFIARERIGLDKKEIDLRMNIGLVEFAGPGFEWMPDAGEQVAAEISSIIKQLDTYRVSQRVISKKNISNESPASMKKVAKTYGVKRIITGNIEPSDSDLTIKTRLYHGDTGELIREETIKAERADAPDRFQKKLLIPVNRLLGVENYELIRINNYVSRYRIGVAIGIGLDDMVAAQTIDVRYLTLSLFFNSRYADAGIQYFGGINHTIYLNIDGNPWSYLGFGIIFGLQLSPSSWNSSVAIENFLIPDATYSLLFGLHARPIRELHLGLYLGPSLGGGPAKANALLNIPPVSFTPHFNFPYNAWLGFVEYVITSEWALRFQVTYYNSGVINVQTIGDVYYDNLVFVLMASYVFTL